MCDHPEFNASVCVNRIEDTGRYAAEVRIECAVCFQPMKFLGLPVGLDINGASVSVDGQEARLAIHPAGEKVPDFPDDVPIGFRILDKRRIVE